MTFDIHPFIKPFYASGYYNNLPPQMLPRSKKFDENKDEHGVTPWMRACMDSFESIARIQYADNLRLVDNERLVNGEFLPNDYIEKCEDCEQEFFDTINGLTEKAGLPKFIKHYDFISTIIKTQIQEFRQTPDAFRIVGKGEAIDTDKLEHKKQFLIKLLNDKIEQRFQESLEQQGVDINQEFESEEQKAQFEEQINQLREQQTPEIIDKLVSYSYRHFAEEWGEYELKDQKLRFSLDKLRAREFYYYLVTGRRFREINIFKNRLDVKHLNYVNVFYHKSPNTEYIQDGDYAGYIDVYSAAEIINKYGDALTEEQIKSLEIYYHYDDGKSSYENKAFLTGSPITYLDTDGNPYNKILPTLNPFINKIAPYLGMNPTVGGMLGANPREFTVTKAYWRSFKKIARLCWINPESGIFEVVKVDESFVVPKYIKVLDKATFSDKPEVNTIVYAWEEEIMQGVKINKFGTSAGQAFYVDIKPCDYQAVSEFNLNRKKLPIAGQIANNINTTSSSQLDILKPYVFMHNIAMNKAVKYMERSLGAFVALELRSIPNQKDWDGDEAIFKWLDAIEETNIAALDTAPSTTLGANSGNQLPRVVDVDNTPKVMQHLSIAANIRQLALSQLGFSPARAGDVEGIDTATGINTTLAKSYNATGSWASEFWDCEQDILKMQLDAALYIEAKTNQFEEHRSKGIITDSFVSTIGDDTLYDLHVYVSDAQEELRQLELIRKLGVELNTTNTSMSGRIKMATLNNSELILKTIEDEERKAQEMQQRMQQLEQQRVEAATKAEQDKLAFEKEKLYAQLENDLRTAWIKSRGYIAEGEQDLDTNSIPDAFEYEKFTEEARRNAEAMGLQRNKQQLEIEKERNRREDSNKKYELELRKIALEKEKILQTAQNVKVLDKGKYPGISKKG